MTSLLIGLAGAAGALARYGLGVAGALLLPATFPWTTIVTNLSGSAMLGVVSGLLLRRGPLSAPWRLPVTVGFLGAYTTFSTWNVETIDLLLLGHSGLATLNVVVSISLGLPVTWLGLVVGKGGTRL